VGYPSVFDKFEKKVLQVSFCYFSLSMFRNMHAMKQNTVVVASHTSTVWSVDFDVSGSRLVSCSDDRTLKIWKQYSPGNTQGTCNFTLQYCGV